MSDGRDYTPYPFAPTSVVVLLAAPWVPALMLVLHGAYGLAPERAWWSVHTGEASVLVLVALAAVFSSGLWGFPWLERIEDGPAVRWSAVALAFAQGLLLVSAAAQVPGALVGVLAAWGGMLVAGYAVMNGLSWLPRGVARSLGVAMSSVVGVVAGVWLGAAVAVLATVALTLVGFALAPMTILVEAYLPLVVPPALALLSGLAGGFLAVRVGRALLIATEDALVSSGFMVLVLLGALVAAGLAWLAVRSLGGIELLNDPTAIVAIGTFAVGAAGTLAFTLVRQGRLRSRFARAEARSGA